MPRPARSLPLALAGACTVAGACTLAGCGDAPLRPPSLTTPAAPSRFHVVRFPRAGLSLAMPADWSELDAAAPLVGLFSSGSATVALWRYPRAGAAPLTGPALRSALDALIRDSRRRDPGLRVLASGTTTLDGDGAVILDVNARVASATRRIRSEHVYLPGAEVVLEAYAPPVQFPRVDRQVFSPARRSLTLTGVRP